MFLYMKPYSPDETIGPEMRPHEVVFFLQEFLIIYTLRPYIMFKDFSPLFIICVTM